MTTTFPTQPVAVISGGLSDIGLATAHALKQAGSSTAAVPVGELIKAEQVTAAMASLCSPAHRNLNGSTLLLDGGLSLLRSPVIKS